jgi:hypothetical protein
MQRLIAELSTDPLRLGYDLSDPQAVADVLNAPRRTVEEPIGAEPFIRWLGTDGRFRRLQDAMTASRDTVWLSAAEAALMMARAGIGFGTVAGDSILAVLLDDAIWTPADRAALESVGARTLTRGQEIGISTVTPEMVKRAIITREDQIYRPPVRPERPDPSEPQEPVDPEPDPEPETPTRPER